MKVSPSNQTLILASESGVPAAQQAPTAFDRLASASTDAVLQRVTIVAARPDATLMYYQADYATADEAGTAAGGIYSRPVASSIPAPRTAGAAIPAGAGRESSASGGAGAIARVSSLAANRGVYLYARTQGNLAESPTTGYLDVHA